MKKIGFLLLILSVIGFGEINAQKPTDFVGKISTINKNWQPGGIFNGEYPEKEILNARTEYTKKLKNLDLMNSIERRLK